MGGLILSPHKGAIVETYAISELMKQRTNLGKKPNLSYFRDLKGFEVDTIADWKHTFAIEIKTSVPSSGNYLQISENIYLGGMMKMPKARFSIWATLPAKLMISLMSAGKTGGIFRKRLLKTGTDLTSYTKNLFLKEKGKKKKKNRDRPRFVPEQMILWNQFVI